LIGGTVVLLARFDPSEALASIERYRVQVGLVSCRRCCCASGALPEAERAKVRPVLARARRVEWRALSGVG